MRKVAPVPEMLEEAIHMAKFAVLLNLGGIAFHAICVRSPLLNVIGSENANWS
jgi:hypothetical protein